MQNTYTHHDARMVSGLVRTFLQDAQDYTLVMINSCFSVLGRQAKDEAVSLAVEMATRAQASDAEYAPILQLLAVRGLLHFAEGESLDRATAVVTLAMPFASVTPAIQAAVDLKLTRLAWQADGHEPVPEAPGNDSGSRFTGALAEARKAFDFASEFAKVDTKPRRKLDGSRHYRFTFPASP